MTKYGLVAGIVSLLMVPLKLAVGNPLALAASADGAAPVNAVPQADLETLQKLHAANETEIEMGKLAQDKGVAKDVKAFGRMLIVDHTAADRAISGFLKQHGLDLRVLATTTSTDPSHETIASRTGADFDRAFTSQMVEDHDKAIDLVHRAQARTADAQLRALLDHMLPALEAHKAKAMELARRNGRV